MFSKWSISKVYNGHRSAICTQSLHRVEAGSNISTVALRVVEGDEKGNQCLGYNWATLFLGDINKGTWPSRLGEPRI
jgi:hypothetical protein